MKGMQDATVFQLLSKTLSASGAQGIFAKSGHPSRSTRSQAIQPNVKTWPGINKIRKNRALSPVFAKLCSDPGFGGSQTFHALENRMEEDLE